MTEMAMREQLDDPETAEALARLMGRAGDIDKLVQRATQANAAADGLLAIATDVVDEQCQKINATGVPVDQRIGSLLELLLKLTEPETAAALGRLIDRLPQISQLLDEVPNLLAIATDVFDEYAKKLKSHNIDFEQSLTQGLHALLWLGSRVSEDELERLGFLLRSDVLDPDALQVVGNAATSLANCQRESCQLQTPDRIGLLGLLKVARDPQVQRSIGFGVRFAKCFGNACDQSSHGK